MPEKDDLIANGDNFAQALRKLRPTAPDPTAARDVWFDAGYRAGRRTANVWKATAALMIAGMVAVATLERRPVNSVTPPIPVAIGQSEIPVPPLQTAEAIRGAEYARLRGALLQEGLRGLGGPELPSGNPGSPPGVEPDRRVDNY